MQQLEIGDNHIIVSDLVIDDIKPYKFVSIKDMEYILKVGDHISVSPIKHEDLLKCLQDLISLHNQKEKTDLPIYKKQL
jgi:uncharacterized protein (UPF0261 family)